MLLSCPASSCAAASSTTHVCAAAPLLARRFIVLPFPPLARGTRANMKEPSRSSAGTTSTSASDTAPFGGSEASADAPSGSDQ